MMAGGLDLRDQRVVLANMPGAWREEIAARLRASGAKAAQDPDGSFERERIQRALDEGVRQLGGISALVVGWRYGKNAPLLSTSDEEIERAVRENVEAPLWWMQSAAREMLRQGGGGRMVVLSSVGGMVPSKDGALVAATQAALQTIGVVGAVELGPRDIRSNVVALGWVDDETYTEQLGSDEARRHVQPDIPTQSPVRLRQIADVCAFLLSGLADGVNGEVLKLDGGYSVTKGSRTTSLPWR